MGNLLACDMELADMIHCGCMNTLTSMYTLYVYMEVYVYALCIANGEELMLIRNP